jgi:hypothetical protein
MKKLSLITLIAISTMAFAAAKEITLETKKVGDAVHWSPEKVEVTQGDTVKFTVKHDLEGGFDFHGFYIPALKVSEQVTRHKPLVKEVKIPADMKPADYPIGCQFHPKHVPAKLVVKANAQKG